MSWPSNQMRPSEVSANGEGDVVHGLEKVLGPARGALHRHGKALADAGHLEQRVHHSGFPQATVWRGPTSATGSGSSQNGA